MLARSAWAGSQRYGAAVWSGDTQSTWDDFNQQFRAGLNMMMSGTTYWCVKSPASLPCFVSNLTTPRPGRRTLGASPTEIQQTPTFEN